MTSKPAASAILPVGSLELHTAKLTADLLSQQLGGRGLAPCAITRSSIVTAHSRLAATGALEFWVTSFSLYHIPLLLDCHLYDKLTNLEGEDEFGTNIFNTVDDRRSDLIRRDFIKIYIGGSVE